MIFSLTLNGSERLTPFEDSLFLATMLRASFGGRDIGAYILTQGTQKNRLCFVFGFECRGVHTTLSLFGFTKY